MMEMGESIISQHFDRQNQTAADSWIHHHQTLLDLEPQHETEIMDVFVMPGNEIQTSFEASEKSRKADKAHSTSVRIESERRGKSKQAERMISLYQDVSKWLKSIEATNANPGLLGALKKIQNGMTEKPPHARDDTVNKENSRPHAEVAAACALFTYAAEAEDSYLSPELRATLAATSTSGPSECVPRGLAKALTSVEHNFRYNQPGVPFNRVKGDLIGNAEKYQDCFEELYGNRFDASQGGE